MYSALCNGQRTIILVPMTGQYIYFSLGPQWKNVELQAERNLAPPVMISAIADNIELKDVMISLGSAMDLMSFIFTLRLGYKACSLGCLFLLSLFSVTRV